MRALGGCLKPSCQLTLTSNHPCTCDQQSVCTVYSWAHHTNDYLRLGEAISSLHPHVSLVHNELKKLLHHLWVCWKPSVPQEPAHPQNP